MLSEWRVGRGRRARALAYLPAAAAVVAILFAGIFAERQSRSLAALVEREAVRTRVELLAAGLQRAIGLDAARAARLIGPVAAASPLERAAGLFSAAGLTDRASGLELALVGIGSSQGGASEANGLPNPVLVPVVLPGADGTLAASPAGGWSDRAQAVWPVRLLTVLALGLIVGPMVRTRRLVGERQRNINRLRDREAELKRLSRRLGLALDASKVGVFDFDIGTGELVWDDRMDDLYGYPPTRRRHTYSHWRDRLHPDDLERAEAEFREAVEVTGRYVSEYRIALPSASR